MINFFSKFKIFFYVINLLLIILYLFPGSLFGCIFFDNCKVQPQITSDFLQISSNHFYAFGLVTILGYFTFLNSEKLKLVLYYLLVISVLLEVFHIVIPERSFQWSDLFGNLLGVIVVIFVKNLINKYGITKK
ncbi:hypothetical protein [Candidatus Pelagibacter sp.]|uniref:hypothetical protein n=1 Tax=Candidatus Pelagibacter sp. TaxID=2024849 RepID=UPI003F84A80F